jgi:hypothetical protein
MATGGIRRHAARAFALALGVYAAGFALDAHLRTRRGPWEATFATEPDGTPRVTVRQPRLGLIDVVFRFPGGVAGGSNLPRTVRFMPPTNAVPFGSAVFEDLTTLPGTVTLELFGHEIEWLPRTLFVDRRAQAWRSGDVVDLPATNRPAFPVPAPAGARPVRR